MNMLMENERGDENPFSDISFAYISQLLDT